MRKKLNSQSICFLSATAQREEWKSCEINGSEIEKRNAEKILILMDLGYIVCIYKKKEIKKVPLLPHQMYILTFWNAIKFSGNVHW